MRHLKTLGLAVVAALALTAFAGAGTASATTLCKENKNPCPAGSRYALPQTIGAATPAGEKAVLAAGSFEVKCDSSAAGTAKENFGAGKGIKGELTGLTFTNCEGTCTEAKAQNLFYNVLAQATGAGDGTIEVTDSPFVGVALSRCFGFETCIYGSSSVTFAFIGDNPAHITVNATLKRQAGGGPLCPVTPPLSWKALYVASMPNPAWIEAEP